MEILKNWNDLSSIELSLFHIKVAYRSMVGEEVSSPEQLGDEVDVSVVLEEAEVFEHEGVL